MAFLPVVFLTILGADVDVAKAAPEIVVTKDDRSVEAYYSLLGVNPCPDPEYCATFTHAPLGGRFDQDAVKGVGQSAEGGGLGYGAKIDHDTEVDPAGLSGVISGEAYITPDLDVLLATPLIRAHGESMFHTEFEATEDAFFELTVNIQFSGVWGQNTDSSFLNNNIDFLFEGIDAQGQAFRHRIFYGLEDVSNPPQGMSVTYSLSGDVRANETTTLKISLLVDRNWSSIPALSWGGFSEAEISFQLDFSGSLFSDDFESGDLCSWGVEPCLAAAKEVPQETPRI